MKDLQPAGLTVPMRRCQCGLKALAGMRCARGHTVPTVLNPPPNPPEGGFSTPLDAEIALYESTTSSNLIRDARPLAERRAERWRARLENMREVQRKKSEKERLRADYAKRRSRGLG